MGSQRDGNGSDRPPEGGGTPDGLPGLPPEWGVVIIPDDLSELDEEAEQVRRDLRRQARQARWRRWLGAPSAGGDGDDTPTLGMPLLIMAVAIVAAVTSLFTVTLSGRLDKPAGQAGTAGSAPADRTVADVKLTDASGATVALRDNLPAVVLLVDGCDCADLVERTFGAAPTGVKVLAVGRTAPTFAVADGSAVRRLADPGGKLAETYRTAAAAAGGATVVLIRGSGEVVYSATGVTTVDDLTPAFTSIAG